jgi:hypothetical protein
MSNFPRTLVILLVLLVAGSSVFAQSGQPKMPLTEVKEGMRGVARTVFRGSEPEEFGVEILGVVPDAVGPHQDLIIGKLSGELAMRTFVFAGMSGSPVFIDGKLVGAISYSFPFAKEPICGITPIEQMTTIFDKVGAVENPKFEPRSFSIPELQSAAWNPAVRAATTERLLAGSLAAVAGQRMTPIATPLIFSGISQATLDQFAHLFSGSVLMPVATAGGGGKLGPMKKADASTLVGGDSVVVQLARGDVSIAAAGTVTMRDGEKIYAFGHPYFSLGSTDLPMNESHVVAVVPSTSNSFKLAVADSLVGSMKQDRATGIYGKLGESPRMIPVTIRLTTSRGREETIKFETAVDEMLTPLILNVGMLNAIGAQERGLGDMAITVNGDIAIKGEPSLTINRRFAGSTAGQLAAASSAVPLAALLKANFDNLEISGINLNVAIAEVSKTATLDRIEVDKTQVRPGETVNATVYARTEAGRIIEQAVKIAVPQDVPAGALSLMIGDGIETQKIAAVQQFSPRTVRELVGMINNIRGADRLFAVITKSGPGAVVGASEMPNLPPSVLATMNNDRSAGGSKAISLRTVSEMPLPPAEHIITGSQTIALEVVP